MMNKDHLIQVLLNFGDKPSRWAHLPQIPSEGQTLTEVGKDNRVKIYRVAKVDHQIAPDESINGRYSLVAAQIICELVHSD